MAANIPADIDPHLICVTGAIVTWWGRIENDLYLDLLTTRNHPSANKIAAKDQIPLSSNKRIKQWAKVRKAIFANMPDRLNQINELRDQLLSASEERNDIVHAHWPYGNKQNPKKLRLQSMKPKFDGSHVFKNIDITPENLEELSERLNSLFHKIMPLTVSFAFENSHGPKDYTGDQ